MRENLERVLQFMATKRIRMHAITSREVLEGNLKAIMRLILALAAHYKPQSVRHHENNMVSTNTNNNFSTTATTATAGTYENVVNNGQANGTARNNAGTKGGY